VVDLLQTVSDCARWALLIALALASLRCNGQESGSDALECGAAKAFRVTPGTCPVADEKSLRWCKDDDEDHWGIGEYCLRSPTGDLYVVLQSFGTTLVNADGWIRLWGDSGVEVEECAGALRWFEECRY
jgi:hypothetical protein